MAKRLARRTAEAGPNKHIRDFLRYYVSLDTAPQYAVMISGPWGAGKTHLVREFFSKEAPNQKVSFVSLYGLASPDEIDWALIQSFHPSLQSRGAKLIGRLGTAALKVGAKSLGVEAGGIKFSDLIGKSADRVYVFDDLERNDMPLTTSLGYINSLVENGGLRAIILSNEEEVRRKDQDYDRIKEKLIGRTFNVQSDFDNAAKEFISKVKNRETKNFITSHIDRLAELYRQSGLNNLRILKQTIWDFERLFKSLSNKHRENESAIDTLFSLFVALSFEFKAGRIFEDDLRDRLRKLVAGRVSKDKPEMPPSRLQAASDRYKDIYLYDTILNDEVLIDLISKGVTDANKIQDSIDSSSSFVNSSNEPPWRTLWHTYERANEEVENALTEVNRQLANDEVVEPGEILHIFGLKLWFSDSGIIDQSRDSVLKEGKSYVDRLYSLGRLRPYDENEHDELRHQSHSKLGFHESKSADFVALFDYLREKRTQAARDRYPEQAVNLLAEMVDDPQLFYQRITSWNAKESRFAHVPVLATLDARKFLDTFMNMHPAGQRIVSMALKSRYEHGQLNKDLASELSWLKALNTEATALLPKLSKLPKYRLREFQKYCLKVILATTAGD